MFGLYIHFPFCVKKCNYCDFLSSPLVSQDTIDDYLQALEKELVIYQSLLKREGQPKLQSIYLGGGTPTLLESYQMVRVLEKCRDLFSFSSGIEITIEANPGTVNLTKLIQLYKAGVNRISYGVQAFDQNLLTKMGRVHSPAEANESIIMAREAGFNNISIDLMYGLPAQTTAQWEETLTQAVELNVQHISVYGLKVEDGTAWGKSKQQGKLTLPEEEITLDMRKMANMVLAENGFERYEISNYCRPGFLSRHNVGYWLGKPFLGVGLGASSDFWNRRFANTTSINRYITLLDKCQLPIAGEELLNYKQRMGETIFLGLRLTKGLNLELFKQRYGVAAEVIYSEEIDKLQERGLLTINQGHLQLSSKAIDIANYVFTFFV